MDKKRRKSLKRALEHLTGTLNELEDVLCDPWDPAANTEVLNDIVTEQCILELVKLRLDRIAKSLK